MFLLLLLLGLVAGVLAGLLGIGGGLLFTPIFFYIFQGAGLEQPVVWTVGTSLFCTFTASLSSSLQQIRQHNLYLKQGLKVGLLGIAGVTAGKMIVESSFYTETVFVFFFALLLIVVAVLFYRRGSGEEPVDHARFEVGWRKAAAAGGGGGMVAAMAGVGGGIVMVPILNLLYKIELFRTVSISSLAIVVISLFGWLQFAFFTQAGDGVTHYALGSVDFGTALPVILGAFTGGLAGARLNRVIGERVVQLAFALLVVVVATAMFYSLFGHQA